MRTYRSLFERLNVNKRSVMLDLKSPRDRERALALAADADVVAEGFRPGVTDRLGVGYDDVRGVNRSIIYCSVSGMGQTGALAHVPGHDINYLAWSGALAPEGGEPRLPAVPVADLAGGMTAGFAICAALVKRMRTGEGERIDVAMADILATWVGADRPVAAAGAEDREQHGVPGYGTFATADGRFIALGVLSEDHFWQPLCDALDLTAHRGLAFAARLDDAPALQAAVAAAVRLRRRDDIVEQLLRAGVPVAPVNDRDDMLDVAHFNEREGAGGYPVRFEQGPAARVTPAPALDAHAGAAFHPR
jgi:crotonobetainyl-CoA:carnitine CoA-transferase CaiB-like acyl-CoA transferase